MTITARLTFRDAQGEPILLTHLDTDTADTVQVDGTIAARTASVELEIVELAQDEVEHVELQKVRRSFRDLAVDQFRRGLDACGFWDPDVIRCGTRSPEGGTCSLRMYHGGLVPLPGEQHERVADPRTPRRIAEMWPAATNTAGIPDLESL